MTAKTTASAEPLDRIRAICLALPGAWEKISHGEPTFWIGKRTFAMFASAGNHHGAGRNAIWCRATHATQDLLISRAPERYFSPPYCGVAGWVGIYLDRRPKWSEVSDRLRHAYELSSAVQSRRRPKR
jgi:predicted DNA-binding protein (MmcQ/YjbR family)